MTIHSTNVKLNDCFNQFFSRFQEIINQQSDVPVKIQTGGEIDFVTNKTNPNIIEFTYLDFNLFIRKSKNYTQCKVILETYLLSFDSEKYPSSKLNLIPNLNIVLDTIGNFWLNDKNHAQYENIIAEYFLNVNTFIKQLSE